MKKLSQTAYRILFHLMAFSFIGTSLYDWSGLVLDNRSIQTLHQAYQKLSHLSAIFRYLLNQASPTTEQGNICSTCISKTESEKIKCVLNEHAYYKVKCNLQCYNILSIRMRFSVDCHLKGKICL